ncbi:hypothetical protein M422DRAFT_779422 [Sphaerobolus stellatus SS14]|uniref:Uncharacterized protein n=1 Tax=Sphaerobolus stellatus (strain SS14) TaxID=990650 RepID=A0A0C9VBJ3_SPHS4|nr:hypothetical protein M422DRAFT_779422 [Sphaerobolus stellatus SS14]
MYSWNVQNANNGNDINMIIYVGKSFFNTNAIQVDSSSNLPSNSNGPSGTGTSSTDENSGGSTGKSGRNGLNEADRVNIGVTVASLFVGTLGL